MANTAKVIKHDESMGYTVEDAFEVLREELSKGIESMKAGKVYTIEEAWKDIDQI